MAEHIDIYEAPTALTAVQRALKKAGYGIYLATLKGEDATAVQYKQPLCLVIGNESTGIASALFSFGTQVRLPQRTNDVSYNASVAAGILLFLIAHASQRI